MRDKFADDYLKNVTEAAQGAKVPCVCCKVTGDHPGTSIAQVAQTHHCDLIYIGSHGWSQNKSGCCMRPPAEVPLATAHLTGIRLVCPA